MTRNRKKRVEPHEVLDVGKIKDPHGLKGEVYLLFFAKEWSWLKKGMSLQFYHPEESPKKILEYRIIRYRPYKSGIVALLDGVSDRNASEALKGALLQIPGSLLKAESEDDFYLNEVLDFSIFLENHGFIGKVIDFSSNGSQDLLVVETEKGVFEVPFVEAFTKKIDHDLKRIEMELPEGLIEF
ncbi:MAG: 16S rRNA processing protein RimM [Bdellovibrionales bacterium]|nr:16S rRNA processing protein RimM [Bdellovibrionales bacterium]